MATLRGSLRVGLRQGFGVTASSLILGDLVENQPANEGRECHVTVGGDLSARIFLSATDRTPPARYASSAQPAAATKGSPLSIPTQVRNRRGPSRGLVF